MWTKSLWYLKGKVVSVIGGAHLDEIEKLWNERTMEMRGKKSHYLNHGEIE